MNTKFRHTFLPSSFRYPYMEENIKRASFHVLHCSKSCYGKKNIIRDGERWTPCHGTVRNLEVRLLTQLKTSVDWKLILKYKKAGKSIKNKNKSRFANFEIKFWKEKGKIKKKLQWLLFYMHVYIRNIEVSILSKDKNLKLLHLFQLKFLENLSAFKDLQTRFNLNCLGKATVTPKAFIKF